MADKPIGKDATGYEILTDAMKALLNQYPGLYENETIKFEEGASGFDKIIMTSHIVRPMAELFRKRRCLRRDAPNLPVPILCSIPNSI